MALPIYVSRNGALILPAQACVAVFTPALYGAYGVYESMQVAQGVVFEEVAHLQRLTRSAALLELLLPADLPTLQRWIAEILAVNAAPDCTLRLFVVGGEGRSEATAFIWPQPSVVYPRHLYRVGAAAITCEGQRFLPEAKSLNTLVNYLARRKAQAAGAHEGLLHHNGYFTEGSNSNLFTVMNGVVLTPPTGDVLAGVTRDVVIMLAAQDGMELREAPLALSELPRWTECFITSTSRHVMPITTIDGRPVGDGRVGPLTRRLMALFEAYFGQRTARAAERVETRAQPA
jgi:branched-subunit amino acid aminotransferase/4-amino-4-deoxychorismate lyase